MSFTF